MVGKETGGSGWWELMRLEGGNNGGEGDGRKGMVGRKRDEREGIMVGKQMGGRGWWEGREMRGRGWW